MAKPTPFEPTPLRLSSVELERFKAAFKPGAVPLDRFNLIVGRNGAGKSTLLEALQWIDATLRQDAREALRRYFGIRDVINVRSRVKNPFFKLRLSWAIEDDPRDLRYEVKVFRGRDGSSPLIDTEELSLSTKKKKRRFRLIETSVGATVRLDQAGLRLVNPRDSRLTREVSDPDRLALARGERTSLPTRRNETEDLLASVRDYWNRAVFLRLSTNRLAAGSMATRKSFEPLLDEEGTNLPALLSELNQEQREDLVGRVRKVLSGITDIKVDKPHNRRDEIINYSLKERMPWVGAAGIGTFDIPSWMLSEGTRRITALFALLVHDPPPSLLCIEEVENGLDPWTVLQILKALKSGVRLGTQVITTTHSPWLLDHVDINDILAVERIDGETRYRRFNDIDEVRQFQDSVPPGARYVNLQ